MPVLKLSQGVRSGVRFSGHKLNGLLTPRVPGQITIFAQAGFLDADVPTKVGVLFAAIEN